MRRLVGLVFGVTLLATRFVGAEAHPAPTDANSDPLLPPGAVRRLETVRCSQAAAYSPDGKFLASGNWDKAVRLWQAATGKEFRQLQGHLGSVTSVAYSPDGKTLASASEDKTLRLWDPGTGKEIRQFQGHQAAVMSVAYAPDGKIIASASADKTVRLWDTVTGKEIRQLRGHQKGVQSVAFALDGKVVVSAGMDPTVHVWDVGTGKGVRQFEGHDHGVESLAIAPGSKIAASASHGEGIVRLWDVATGKGICRLHQTGSMSVTFAPDGKTLASGSSSGEVRLWEIATWKERAVLKTSQAGAVYSISWSPDSQWLASAHVNMTCLFLYPAGGDPTEVTFGDGIVLIWDFLRLPGLNPTWKGTPSAKTLHETWTDLARDNAPQAFQAIRLLAAHPAQAVPFLQQRLKPAAPVDPKRLAQLIADLESNDFPARQKATEELERLGDLAVAALEKVLADKPTLETRTRIERLLETADRIPPSELLRSLRALEALEHAGTPQARQLMEALAKGADGARLTREAQAVLQRLAKSADKVNK